MRDGADRLERVPRRLRELRREFGLPGHPPWVGRGVFDAAVGLTGLGTVWCVHALDRVWVSALTGALVAAALVVFGLVPWVLRIVDGFVAGYRGEPR